MNSEASQPTPELPNDTLPVEDLDAFVRHLVAWHNHQVAAVQHLTQLPEGSTFQIGDGPEAEQLVMESKVLAGFKFGVEMALMQLGKLPFLVEVEPEAEDAPV